MQQAGQSLLLSLPTMCAKQTPHFGGAEVARFDAVLDKLVWGVIHGLSLLSLSSEENMAFA